MEPRTDPSAEIVATRAQILDWMRDAGDSAADFYEAVANYFGVEDEEVEGY